MFRFDAVGPGFDEMSPHNSKYNDAFTFAIRPYLASLSKPDNFIIFGIGADLFVTRVFLTTLDSFKDTVETLFPT